MSDIKLQGEVSLDTTKGEASVDRFGKAVNKMARETEVSAGKAGDAVGKIGDGADGSAVKLNRAERTMTASLLRLREQMQLAGKTASEKYEFKIDAKGLDKTKFTGILDEIRALEAQAGKAGTVGSNALNGMGMSAKATAAALRGVPAQFTDIITSLQGGQAPLTVFLQQGGQLKDMFGGAGNAARALGGYVAGLVNPFTLAAAAVVGLGIAMAKVNSIDAEFAGLSTRLAATGRASVASVAGLRSMVDELNKIPGVSRSAATSIIDEFSKVQGVGGAIFKGLGASVADFANATGTDLPAAAKKLAGAFADPAKGVRELESALGTLTAEQILTIESMAAMGDKAGAQAAMLDALKQAVGGVGGPMTDLGKATDRLSNSWDTLVHSFSQSEGLRTINTLLAGVIDKFTWLLNNAPSSMFGPLGYMAGQAAAAANRLSISYVPPEFNTPQGGSGRGTVNPALVVNSNEQVKAALEVTKAFKSQAGALSELKDQAKVARDALSLLESQNKGGSEAAKKLRESLAGINERIESIGKKNGAGAAQAIKAEQNSYEGLIASIRAKVAEQTLEYQGGQKLTESQKLKIKLDEDLRSGKLKLTAAHKAETEEEIRKLKVVEEQIKQVKVSQAQYAQFIQTQDELNAAYVAESKAREAAKLAVNGYVQGINESNDALQFELSVMGLSEQARNVALEQYRIELDLKKRIAAVNSPNSGFENDEQRDAEIARLTGAAAIAKANASSKVFLSEWQNSVKVYDDIFRQGFADMLNKGEDGWKSFTKSLATTFKTTVADTLYKAFAQPFVIKLVGQLLGLTGGSGAAAGATNGYTSGASGGSPGVGNILGLFGDKGSGSITDLLGSTGMGKLDIAGFDMSWLSKGLGAVADWIPYVGWAVAAVNVVKSLVKKFDTSGTPHVGSLAQYSEAGGLSTSQKHGAFGMGFGGVDYNEGAATLVSGVSKTIVGILDSVSKTFGGTGGFKVSTGFADDSSKDGAWGGLLIEQFGKALVNWDDTRSSKWAPKVFADGEQGQKEYLAALAKDVTGVLKEMDLPKWAQETLTALGDAPALESLATAIDAINATKAALDVMGKNLVGFAGYSDDAASALMKASGGISALATNASAYYENFYTEAERQANATRDVTDALSKVNIALPASRDAYRALVEQYTAMGTAGASTLAVLLSLAGSFAAITTAGEAFGKTVAEIIASLRNPTRTNEDIARNTIGLEDKLFQTENAGNVAALRERELRSLTEAEKALQRRIWLIEDEAKKTTERDGLELQYLQLIGDTAAIRERERAALDETNRALYDRNAALADEQAMLSKFGITAASMADVIRDGMLGRMSQEDVGAKLTEMIVGGINNALASRFADQISSLFIDSIITPMLTAVTTGGSISAAVSQSSIDAVIASATAAAANMAAIFNDPAWKAAMEAINAAIKGVSGAVAKPAGPAASGDYSSWMSANEASYQAAQDAKKAWKSVGDTILDEVKRIRGDMVGGTAQSMANAQTQFAIATAQARAGDQDAAKSLPGLSQALLTIAEAQASSTLELRRIQAATAASLELTNSEIAKKFGLQVPSYDVGTNYVPQDMLAMVHEGEAIVPRAFNPALAGGTSGGSDTEIRGLRTQVASLEKTVGDLLEKIERNTKRTADDMFDINRNGLPSINQPGTTLAVKVIA